MLNRVKQETLMSKTTAGQEWIKEFKLYYKLFRIPLKQLERNLQKTKIPIVGLLTCSMFAFERFVRMLYLKNYRALSIL